LKHVLITSNWFTQRYLDILKSNFEVTLNHRSRWLTEDELIQVIGDYDAVIAALDPFTQRVFQHAGRLKIIARRGIGYDNIDLKAASTKGVYVTITPVMEEHVAVAEFTVALILSLLRKIPQASRSLRSGSWERKAFLGKSMRETCVGVLGLGAIGSRVASILSSLGSKVVYSDPYVNSTQYTRVSLHELFMVSDVVTIHAPLTNETRGMVNMELLGKMKVGSYLVNTARAEIVDTQALIQALTSGILAGAAFDVFNVEPPANDELLKMENVLVTPHIAAYTEDSFAKIDEVCTENVIRVLIQGREPLYSVVQPKKHV
jgi:D-3-phosphoglycerate dehydrogenase